MQLVLGCILGTYMQPEWAVAQAFTGVCDQKRFKEGYLWLGLDSGQLQQQVIKNKCCQIKTLKTVVSQLPKKQQNPRGWFFIQQ